MKKLFFIALLAIGTLMADQVKAQTKLVSTSSGLTIDTVTNTGTKILFAKVTGYKETVTIIVSLTKISGTIAGTVKPVVSADGVNWYDGTGFTASDTAFTATDTGSQGKAYQCKKGYQFYGIQWTGSGTMSGSFIATLLGRKQSD